MEKASLFLCDFLDFFLNAFLTFSPMTEDQNNFLFHYCRLTLLIFSFHVGRPHEVERILASFRCIVKVTCASLL